MADWNKIKTEYITTDTSYRKLAEKYGVNATTIAVRAKAEKWVELREQQRSETLTKTLGKIADEQASKMARIASVSDKLLDKIERIVEKTEPRDISAKDIRALTAAVKDLKEIQGIRSELDKQEQEARIANLRRQAQAEENANGAVLVVEGLPEEFKA